jgi:hypothetical protein
MKKKQLVFLIIISITLIVLSGCITAGNMEPATKEHCVLVDDGGFGGISYDKKK